MSKKPRNPLVPLLSLALAFMALVAIGAVKLRHDYLQRGLPGALPEAVQHGSPGLGFNVDLEQYEDVSLSLTLKAIEATGAVAVKQSFYFCPEFDWDKSDKIVEEVGRSNLTLVPLLDGCPGEDFLPPAEPQIFAKWAGQFAERYGDQLSYYIIWDEPNLAAHWGNQPVNPADYGALLAAASEAIKENDHDAAVVSAPLAPTVETGPVNLADPLYLEALYELGAGEAFDVAAGKPYGFNTSPDDRDVDIEHLNFSRVILLREVMERYGDGEKALWAGNWGWNTLPANWEGAPSIWGQVSEETRIEWTAGALKRARNEWPWMGLMFLEHWQPDTHQDDPHLGFTVEGRPLQGTLAADTGLGDIAYPGFWWAAPSTAFQEYRGSWRFSPEFGADVGESGDRAIFRFWGTDVALNVRRADYNGRFYVYIDGKPAGNLPDDGNGPALVLNAAVPGDDSISTELVAGNLEPGEHLLSLIALRATDQWALKGFTVGYELPSPYGNPMVIGLGLVVIIFLAIALYTAKQVSWTELSHRFAAWRRTLGERRQALLTASGAALVAFTGWLTWGEQAVGVYHRLGESGQLALTAAFASIFYVTPFFFVYVLALMILFVLILLRPAWGIALIAFSLPYYVKPKPMLGYQFSPVEVFLLLTVGAAGLAAFARWMLYKRPKSIRELNFRWIAIDTSVLIFTLVATASLLFTERLDVAANEWRVIILEPALFYFLFRFTRLKEREIWTILDAFVLGGLTIASIGLFQYVTGQNLITAEGGLMRLRAVYGSPNNVALYLGRIVPILIAMSLMGKGLRRKAYIAALVPITAALILTYSKGSLLLGIPASLIAVLVFWRRSVGGRTWPWLVGLGIAGILAVILVFQIPQLAGRLDLQGDTGFVRINLWQSSVNMLRDHPIFGVGLDNFLYEYRGRYILDGAWYEPNISHPHNIFLDFSTRIGLVGFAAGLWMILLFFRVALWLPSKVRNAWKPVAVGILGSLIYTVVHGLVDHSYFLVDLAFAFQLLLGVAVWLQFNQLTLPESATKEA